MLTPEAQAVVQAAASYAIAVDWKGKSDLAVPTQDGVKEPLNRRVTIDINF